MYCGPGPDDKFWAVTHPVDSIDQTCQDHDKAYKKCLRNLSRDTGMQYNLLMEDQLDDATIPLSILFLRVLHHPMDIFLI